MRRTRRFSEVLGYCRSSVALGDPGTVDVWRRPVDLSLCSIVQQIFVFFLLALSFFHSIDRMATRRTCISVLRQTEAFYSTWKASPSPRNFSSQSNNWTYTPRGINEAKRRVSPCSRQSYGILTTTTPSSLRNQRLFSSTPTPRHGHLDPPKPGEECVPNPHILHSITNQPY
jgi:hypothetical protein